ncbi:TonB-dependent receptor [Caulobacter mirabilis]|uniref:TonB-dependent receptor n=1 Tax=Caulobacter mirabilis TaxID=69666 RepID=A0A2D2AZH5_9CAUL|nr:TonB-dependent receptor [Caulobacter mirabilis]ATQ43337.1 TonB-dependent receptor [Caulobacter mirabilis]
MNKGYRGALRLALAGSAACGALLFASVSWAQAVAIDVPAQPLAEALRELGKETGVNILFSPQSVADRRAVAVKGNYTPLEAARRLAAQANLEVVEDGSGAIIVRPRSAQAQPSEGASVDQGSEVAELVVTGSRLRRTTFDAPTPMVDLDRSDLLESGYTDLGEALTDLPGVDIGVNLSTSQSAVQDNGLSTVSLRSLGQNRTLTLIDGRRTVSNAGNKNAVSLSSIPEFFVDRVEIITGGASAVYGSDAVSGVVNIITESKLEGVRARAVAGITEHGGGSTTEYSVGAGRRFFDDRLYVMASATVETQNILRARDRKWAQRSVLFNPATNSVTVPDLSSTTPGGRYRTNAFFYDDTGLRTNFVTAVNGYDTRLNGTLIAPADYATGALKVTYDVTDNLRIWGQFLASRVETNSVREPYGPTSTTTFGVNDEFTVGNIARNNPYVPTAIFASSTSSISWRRRMMEVGEMEIYNRRTTLRGWVGVEGTVFGGWDWHLTYGYGEYDGYQSRNNGINLQNLKFSLDAERVGTEIRCRDATARANGCVALNPFGVGSITPEMANYIRANAWYRPQNRLDTVEGYITGELFELPAGPVDVAVGFEMRREKTRTLTDEVTEAGVSNFAYIPRYRGLIEAKEAFVEVAVPLVRDMPFAHRLEVEGAVRVADYNLKNVGTTLSYRAGLQWAPIEDVTVRAAWSRAQRAPDTTELYSPPRDDFDDVVDICNGVTATTTGVIAQNCRANTGIAAAIALNGVFTQDDDNINAPNGGNPNLKEETADTLTVGFVVRPRFAPGLDFSLDYYNIKVKDSISSLSNRQQLLECYQANVPTASNPFCSVIIRDAEGQLVKIFNLQDNLNELRASGVDVALRYRFDLERFRFPGDFTFKVNYSHRLELEQEYDGIQGVETSKWLGEVGTSEHEGRASLAWRHKNWNLQWTANYIGEAVDSNTRVEAAKAAGIANPLYLNVDAYWRNDLAVKFYPMTSNKDLRLFGTIKNVFDNNGPFLPSGTDSGSAYNYSAVYGVAGRAYTLGLQLAF